MSESSQGNPNKFNSELDKKPSSSRKNKGKSKSTNFNYQLFSTQPSEDDGEDEDEEQITTMENYHNSTMPYSSFSEAGPSTGHQFHVLPTSGMSKKHTRTNSLNKVKGPSGIKKQKNKRTTYRNASLDEIHDLGYIHEFRIVQCTQDPFSMPFTPYGNPNFLPGQFPDPSFYSTSQPVPSYQYAVNYFQPSSTTTASPHYMLMATAPSQHQQQLQQQPQVQFQPPQAFSHPMGNTNVQQNQTQSLSQRPFQCGVVPSTTVPVPTLSVPAPGTQPTVTNHGAQINEQFNSQSHSKTKSLQSLDTPSLSPLQPAVNNPPQSTSLSASPTRSFQSLRLRDSPSSPTHAREISVRPLVPKTNSNDMESPIMAIHNNQPQQIFYQHQTQQQLGDPIRADVPGDRSEQELNRFGYYTYQQTPSGTRAISNVYPAPAAATIQLTSVSWNNPQNLQPRMADQTLPIHASSQGSPSRIYQESNRTNEISPQTPQNMQQQRSSSNQQIPNPQQIIRQPDSSQNLLYRSNLSTTSPFQADPYHQIVVPQHQFTQGQNIVLQTNPQFQQQFAHQPQQHYQSGDSRLLQQQLAHQPQPQLIPLIQHNPQQHVTLVGTQIVPTGTLLTSPVNDPNFHPSNDPSSSSMMTLTNPYEGAQIPSTQINEPSNENTNPAIISTSNAPPNPHPDTS